MPLLFQAHEKTNNSQSNHSCSNTEGHIEFGSPLAARLMRMVMGFSSPVVRTYSESQFGQYIPVHACTSVCEVNLGFSY